jgi:hypothetical protein
VKLYNWLIAFAAGVGGFLFGYEIGIIKYVSKVTMAVEPKSVIKGSKHCTFMY